METLFEELKRYVQWRSADEHALRELHAFAAPEFERIADVFYRRILDHTEARTALEGGESQVGRLKVTLKEWMDSMLLGPWDEAYYERRARIGRVHVRIARPRAPPRSGHAPATPGARAAAQPAPAIARAHAPPAARSAR